MFQSGYTPGSIAGLLSEDNAHNGSNSKLDKLFSSPCPVMSVRKKLIAEKLAKRRQLERTKQDALESNKTSNVDITQKIKRKNLKKIAKITRNNDSDNLPARPESAVRGESDSGDDVDSEPRHVAKPDKASSVKQQSKPHSDRKTMRMKTKLLKDANRDKKKRTVFLGNLPNTISKKTVKQLVGACGTVESIRFRSAAPANPKMPKKGVVARKEFHPNMNSLNAYVVFENTDAAIKAVKLNGTSYEDQHICVDYMGTKSKHDHKKSLFVGNLPFDAKEEEVREHFAECGDIANVRLVRDKFTRIGKGFGYILFMDKDSVDLALKFESEKFKGRKLRVERSTEQAKKSATGSEAKRNSKVQSADPTSKILKRKKTMDNSGSISPAKKKKKDKPADKSTHLTASKLKEKKKKKLRHRLDKKKKQKMANILTGKLPEKLKKKSKNDPTMIVKSTKLHKSVLPKDKQLIKTKSKSTKINSKRSNEHMQKNDAGNKKSHKKVK